MTVQDAISKSAIKPDPVVGRLLGGRHDPLGRLICIGGFVGESPRDGHVRLFTTLDFSECLDIPERAIVGHEKVEKPGVPGGSYVWVKRGTVLSLTTVSPDDGQSIFLQGPLLNSNAAVRKMRTQGLQGAGFFSSPFCFVVVATATVSLLICTVNEPPEGPDPDPDPDPDGPIIEGPELLPSSDLTRINSQSSGRDRAGC
jgi:hypothetical protein